MEGHPAPWLKAQAASQRALCSKPPSVNRTAPDWAGAATRLPGAGRRGPICRGTNRAGWLAEHEYPATCNLDETGLLLSDYLIDSVAIMSKKKYQVFLSSTFTDLKPERQAVSRAILNLGHISAGMELFPAADEAQLTFIRKVIDDCDYYVLIIGGRYGSVSDSGLSFTESEYKYANEKNKPILVFLHKNISDLKALNVESDPEKIAKLQKFRETVSKGRLVQFWNNVEDLEPKALLALVNAFNEQPQTGWIRDTGELTTEAQNRLDYMQKRHDIIRERFESFVKSSRDLRKRLESYESFDDANVEVRYETDSYPVNVTRIGAESIIQEFAAPLTKGLSLAEIESGLIQLIRHSGAEKIKSVSQSSVNNVALFLDVFELGASTGAGLLELPLDKKWLLKVAFKPLKNVMAQQHDDEIPF